MLLQLVNDDWSLTKAGEFVRHLPVSPETGAMLCEAKMLDEQRMREPNKSPRVMRDIVIIAAISESHGLRQDSKIGHKGDQHRTSDLLDGMNAFRTIRKEPIARTVLAATESYIANATSDELTVLQQQRKELAAFCLKQNVSLNGFIEVARLSDEITNRLGQLAVGIRVDARDEIDKYDTERYGELQRCILNGNVNRLFIYENGGLRDLLRDYDKCRSDAGAPFNGYAVGRDSIVLPPKEGDLMVGELREVRRDKTSDQVALIALTNVTAIPADIFINWAAARAASHQAIISEGTIHGRSLNAIYADKAHFEITVSYGARAKANTLVDETN
jgi:hypothetical protein